MDQSQHLVRQLIPSIAGRHEPLAPAPAAWPTSNAVVVTGWIAAVLSFLLPFAATAVAVALGVVLITHGRVRNGTAMIVTSVALTALMVGVALSLGEA
jgi:hypothetical protein